MRYVYAALITLACLTPWALYLHHLRACRRDRQNAAIHAAVRLAAARVLPRPTDRAAVLDQIAGYRIDGTLYAPADVTVMFDAEKVSPFLLPGMLPVEPRPYVHDDVEFAHAAALVENRLRDAYARPATYQRGTRVPPTATPRET